METGTVKQFNVQKRFGFIVRDDDLDGRLPDQLWFHFNEGQVIDAMPGKSEPEFVGKTVKGSALRDPKEGDRVRFQVIGDGTGRSKASPWGYDSHFKRAIEIIGKRPPPTTYRVLETMNSIVEDPGVPKVLWEGTDLGELLRKYPVPTGRQSPSADPLLPYYSDSDNIFETRYWFEKKTETGWEGCPDPRPLSGVNRQFERITRGR